MRFVPTLRKIILGTCSMVVILVAATPIESEHRHEAFDLLRMHLLNGMYYR